MIKAHGESISFITGSKKFVIPFFQRKYVWTNENWEDLWETLMSDDKTNFLGSLILKDCLTSNDITELSVIDGQQRLTTLSILIRAIIDGFLDSENDEIYNTLQKALFNISEEFVESENGKPISVKTKAIKLENSAFDKKYYEDVINGLYKKTYKDYLPYNENNPRVLSCYAFFMDKVENAVINKEYNIMTKNLINKLIIDTRKSLVVITIGNDDHEQEIFDTINSAGVRLTSSDIIKNAIFNSFVSLYKEDPSTNERAYELTKEKYDKTWFNTFECDEPTINIWLSKVSKGRRERTHLELFLQSYAIIKRLYNPTLKGQKLEKLSDYYKDYIERLKIHEIDDFVKELCKYANVYQKYFIEEKNAIVLHGLKYVDDTVNEDINEIKHILQITTFMETNTFDAYILKIIYDNKNVKQLLFELEIYLMRNYIVQKSTDKNYNNESYEIMFNPSKSAKYYIDQNDLNDSNVKKALLKINNDPAKLVLMWIELWLRNNEYADKDCIEADKKKYQLEHILPQNCNETKWPVDFLTIDSDGNKLSDEIISANHDKALLLQNDLKFKIGNMTLLKGGKNAELQNESFINKKEGYINSRGKKVKGYEICSDFLITRESVLKYDVWDKDAINERTELLANYVINDLWPVDNSIFTKKVVNEDSEITFDINDESTYDSITTGKLAYNLISKLLNENIISEDELKQLVTKEYAKNFKGVFYPVLALNRTDNMGGSNKIRYYKDPINVNGIDYYISHEWFEDSRKDLIEWYKNHLSSQEM